MRVFVCFAVLASSLWAPTVGAEDEPAAAFADWRQSPQAVEAFLRSARVIDSERIPVGISRPLRLTLEGANGVQARAIWKTVDIYEPKMVFEDGSFELNFRDTYKSEIAAWELDKMLGIGLVPPTVERRIDDETGALRLWIEGAVTEAERQEKGMQAPDPLAWSNEVAAVRLFFNLTSNSDFSNIRNLLVDPGFHIRAIDHSRAFRTKKKLVSEPMLLRFSRGLLDRMEALDRDSIEDRLGAWLTASQIKALLKRRDLILARVDKMVELKGEEAILFD